MMPLTTEEGARLRRLTPEDLEHIVRIDQAHTGAPRRAFMRKRLAATQRAPQRFFGLGVELAGTLAGFALVRLQSGEFGELERAAVLDAIGIDPDHEQHGLGHFLMDGVVDTARALGARGLHSQVDWTRGRLLNFFYCNGFVLSERLVLERSTASPFAEAGADS